MPHGGTWGSKDHGETQALEVWAMELAVLTVMSMP